MCGDVEQTQGRRGAQGESSAKKTGEPPSFKQRSLVLQGRANEKVVHHRSAVCGY